MRFEVVIHSILIGEAAGMSSGGNPTPIVVEPSRAPKHPCRTLSSVLAKILVPPWNLLRIGVTKVPLCSTCQDLTIAIEGDQRRLVASAVCFNPQGETMVPDKGRRDFQDGQVM